MKYVKKPLGLIVLSLTINAAIVVLRPTVRAWLYLKEKLT